MIRSTQTHLALLLVGLLLIAWQYRLRLHTGRQLTAVQAEIGNLNRQLEERRSALEAGEQRYHELAEAERRAGNGTLLTLMRERAAATRADLDAAAETRSVGPALASILESPEQQALDQEHRRHNLRAEQNLFFNLLNLPAEKREAYIDLQIEKERRQSARTAALLRGTLALDDALRERDADEAESEQRKREVLGPEGYAFLQSIANDMRNNEARRLFNLIQQNMGSDTLNQEQGDRLKELMKTELCTIPLDNTDLFRTPDDWVQIVSERQQNVLRGAAGFLTPAQMEMLKTLAAADLEQKRGQMILKRKSLGIK
jgi:hypothetical protein